MEIEPTSSDIYIDHINKLFFYDNNNSQSNYNTNKNNNNINKNNNTIL